MKTKTVIFYVDLVPCWQDSEYLPYANTSPGNYDVPKGGKRIAIAVELPCIGGSADVSETIVPKLVKEIDA